MDYNTYTVTFFFANGDTITQEVRALGVLSASGEATQNLSCAVLAQVTALTVLPA